MQLVTPLECALLMPQDNYSYCYTTVCKDTVSVQCHVRTDKCNNQAEIVLLLNVIVSPDVRMKQYG